MQLRKIRWARAWWRRPRRCRLRAWKTGDARNKQAVRGRGARGSACSVGRGHRHVSGSRMGVWAQRGAHPSGARHIMVHARTTTAVGQARGKSLEGQGCRGWGACQRKKDGRGEGCMKWGLAPKEKNGRGARESGLHTGGRRSARGGAALVAAPRYTERAFGAAGERHSKCEY